MAVFSSGCDSSYRRQDRNYNGLFMNGYWRSQYRYHACTLKITLSHLHMHAHIPQSRQAIRAPLASATAALPGCPKTSRGQSRAPSNLERQSAELPTNRLLWRVQSRGWSPRALFLRWGREACVCRALP